MDPSGTGLWSGELRSGDPPEAAAAAAELDELGYPAPTGQGPPERTADRGTLAASRTRGTHTSLMICEHTSRTRAELGARAFPVEQWRRLAPARLAGDS